MGEWIVYCAGNVDFYPSKEHALRAAAEEIEDCRVDGEWNDEVDGIFVAKITHETAQKLIPVAEEHMYMGRLEEGDDMYEFEMKEVMDE